MPLLHLDSLPRNTTKSTVVRLLIQVGNLDKRKVGLVTISGNTATVEVPERDLDRLVAALDGANLANQHIRAWCDRRPASRGDEDHFDRLLRLLDVEAEAEAEQSLARLRRMSAEEAEQSGNTLIGVVIRDEYSGLGGRCLLTLAKSKADALPWTRLSVGSPVLLSPQQARKSEGWRGVVSQRTRQTIQVALNSFPETDERLFRLDASHDEVARLRQRHALQRAQAAKANRQAELRDILLGEGPSRFHDETAVTMLDASLNDSQQAAVRFAISARDVAIVHGPPGTGKTTTVVEIIRQLTQAGQKVLACAPSNMAVDNLFDRLLATNENAVRLGHPARVTESLRAHTLDLMVDNHPDLKRARKLVKEAMALFHQASRFTRAKPAAGAKREMREEAKQLIVDARHIERQVVTEILDNAAVLCATTTSLDSEILGQREFDVAVIDEACQSTEPGCWIPLLRCNRVILAGDHCQLPPTVISREAANEGFSISMLERLMESPDIARRLDVQYRMHEQIMAFSSAEFYTDSLQAHATVSSHVLAGLAGVQPTELTNTPIHFVDTAGAGYDEELEPDGESRRNPREAALVQHKVRQLLDAGVDEGAIGIITPYAAQVRLLRQLLSDSPRLEIDSVDGFQGREKEAIVISLVRSNAEGEIGFLADTRRMNVALTRARRKLIVIGDSATIGNHPFYRRMLEYFETVEAYHTVWEEDL